MRRKECWDEKIILFYFNLNIGSCYDGWVCLLFSEPALETG
jgi:tRNA splicing ligase